MWKRWSFKSLPAKGDGVETNLQSPSGGGVASPAIQSSVKPETVGEAPTGEPASLEVADAAASPQVTGENAVVSDTSPAPTTVVASGGFATEEPSKTDNDGIATSLPSDSVEQPSSPPHAAPISEDTEDRPSASLVIVQAKGVPGDAVVSTPERPDVGDPDSKSTSLNILQVPPLEQSSPRPRRISFRSFAFFYGRDKQPPSTPSTVFINAPAKPNQYSRLALKLLHPDKYALSSALVLRSLILGPSASSVSNSSRILMINHTQSKLVLQPSRSDLKKAKSHLLKPKAANAVIAQLRRLPLPDGPTVHGSGNASSESLVTHPDAGGAPIHAVCLPCTDEEAERTYFSRLRTTSHSDTLSPSPRLDKMLTTASTPPSVGTASLESLVSVLKDLRLVSLLNSPDLGLGQPVSEHDAGPLTGSIPSAGTVVDGLEEITKQLMALGFATSKAVFPSHAGIYPPEDRMSVLTYWWGLELVLPEPSIKYLSKAKSISNALLNFLSAVALFNNGVREVLPFIRYIANFVDFEWSAIQSQDKGKGVVCAATWVMPAAMVPRPWDFSSPPPPPPNPNASKTPASATPASPESAPPSSEPVPDPHEGLQGDKTPVSSSPQDPAVPYPPAPMTPMLPTLMVTPATLPRSVVPPEQEAAA